MLTLAEFQLYLGVRKKEIKLFDAMLLFSVLSIFLYISVCYFLSVQIAHYMNIFLDCSSYYLKGALSAKIVNFCYPKKLSDMIDALIKRFFFNL